jgi:hypothetical protein
LVWLKNLLENVGGRALRRLLKAACLGTLVLIVSANILTYVSKIRSVAEYQAAESLIPGDVAGLRTGATVIVPYELLQIVAKEASSSSLKELGRNCATALDDRSITPFLTRHGISKEVGDLFARDFSEDEQALTVRLFAMAGVRERDGLNLRVWAPDDISPRFGFLTEKEAVATYVEKNAAGLILPYVPRGLVPAKSYEGRYYLFLSN